MSWGLWSMIFDVTAVLVLGCHMLHPYKSLLPPCLSAPARLCAPCPTLVLCLLLLPVQSEGLPQVGGLRQALCLPLKCSICLPATLPLPPQVMLTLTPSDLG